MYLIYNILLLITGIISAPYILFKVLTDARYNEGIHERFGYISPGQKTSRRFVVHASSVGEVNVAYPFTKKLMENYPDCEMIVTVMTPEGYALAKSKFEGLADVFFFPIDYKSSVKRFLDALQPDAMIIIEREIWANFLQEAKRRNILIGMINGRISEKSVDGYKLIKGFISDAFRNIDFFLMQEEIYKERLSHFLDAGAAVEVTGNIKFDIDDSFFEIEEKLDKILEKVDYIIAASTHYNEEKKFLTIVESIKEDYPHIKTVIAPRHVQRCEGVQALLDAARISYIKRSELDAKSDLSAYDVILVDTIGDLAAFFKHARLVFMGGSLVDVGGHNILEPAYFGKPIIFGKYMYNFTDAMKLILGGGGAWQVANEHELKQKVISLLQDEGEAKMTGNAAKSALEMNKGALADTVAAVRKYLN